MEKCGGGVGKCVGVWGEVGCVEKCGGGGVYGKMWGRCGKVYWGAGNLSSLKRDVEEVRRGGGVKKCGGGVRKCVAGVGGKVWRGGKIWGRCGKVF